MDSFAGALASTGDRKCRLKSENVYLLLLVEEIGSLSNMIANIFRRLQTTVSLNVFTYI